jgi:hypothetical protein
MHQRARIFEDMGEEHSLRRAPAQPPRARARATELRHHRAVPAGTTPRCRHLALRAALALGSTVAPAAVQAAALVPGPAEPGHDAALAAKLARVDRQIHGIMTVPLGWGLEAFVSDPAARDAITLFVIGDAPDFESATGQHIYAVLDTYEEFGDLGMFGGVQAAGDAFSYVVLRDGDAPAEAVAAARAELLAAIDGLHWYMQITGEPGVIARGLRRIEPQDGAPPLPGVAPATVPLFDDAGQPQPAVKMPTWREDRSGALPELIWLDDTSKDQFIGYVFALGAVYDSIAHDESIDPTLRDRLVEDARALAHSLMTPRDIDGGTIDLVLMDADGRPTSFHDLAAEQLIPGMISDYPVNPFNAVMALGAMRTLYQITGDADIGAYYYDELIGARGYLELAQESLSLVYFGVGTNYSNVNMAFCAIWGLLRFEPDLGIADAVRGTLVDQLYPESDQSGRSARGLQQSFFDFMVAGFAPDGTDGVDPLGAQALADGVSTLVDHPDAPLWDDAVENCDAAELAVGTCTAIDGTTTLTLAGSLGWGDTVVALEPLPIAIRPRSNFAWRSNPHAVNGSATTRLDPGGELHAAYWMGRMLQRGDDGMANVSPDARGRPEDPEPGGSSSTGDGGGSGADETAGGSADAGTAVETHGDSTGAPGHAGDAAGEDGCGCASAPGTGPRALLLPLVLALGCTRTRRTAPRGLHSRAHPR